MRRVATIAGTALGLALGAGRAHPGAEDVPPPRFDRVDRARPEACLALDPHAGDAASIRALAAPLRRETAEATLAAVDRFVARSLAFDPEAFDRWRTVEQMLADGTYGGCADHAMIYGTLLRACGVPTVWVKSMDLPWIERFRAGRFDPARDTWSGHVFLEVHLDGAWRLLDAAGRRLHRTYDPERRLLPGERYAYDKGGQPYELVLSLRWEPWKRQTAAFFEAHDPRAVLGRDRPPAATGDARPASPRVFVTGNDPRWRWAAAAAADAGAEVALSFNADFERVLPTARGQELVVTCSRGEPVFPAALRSAWLPEGYERALAAEGPDAGRTLERRLADGTRVVLVPSTGRHDLVRAVRAALER